MSKFIFIQPTRGCHEEVMRGVLQVCQCYEVLLIELVDGFCCISRLCSDTCNKKIKENRTIQMWSIKYRDKMSAIVVVLFKYFNEFGRIDQVYILNVTGGHGS